MEHLITNKTLLEMHGEELKEYLLTLPLEERRRVIRELLKAREEIEESLDQVHEDAF